MIWFEVTPEIIKSKMLEVNQRNIEADTVFVDIFCHSRNEFE